MFVGLRVNPKLHGYNSLQHTYVATFNNGTKLPSENAQLSKPFKCNKLRLFEMHGNRLLWQ